jgi:hypothetical protein
MLNPSNTSNKEKEKPNLIKTIESPKKKTSKTMATSGYHTHDPLAVEY